MQRAQAEVIYPWLPRVSAEAVTLWHVVSKALHAGDWQNHLIPSLNVKSTKKLHSLLPSGGCSQTCTNPVGSKARRASSSEQEDGNSSSRAKNK